MKLRMRTSHLAVPAALALAVMASLTLGSRPVAPAALWQALFGSGPQDPEAAALLDLRWSRTLLGLLVGAALGVSGVMMQAVTRNPLADPGLLGINAGALLAMLLGAGFFGLRDPGTVIGLALAGAAVAALMVHAIGFAGPPAGIAARLVLAGVAVSALFGGTAGTLLLADPVRFDHLRGWATGALATPDLAAPAAVAPVVAIGLLLAMLGMRAMNVLALGDEVARAAGVKLGQVRLVGSLAATLLAGAATAGAGPIAFLGLMVPHLARSIAGTDQRRILAVALLLAPTLLLVADVVGRLVMPPREMPAGIVMAFIGPPALIILVRSAWRDFA